MQAKDVMSRKPEFLPPSATLKQAADQMRTHDYGFIPVGENDRLIGALTDRDIAIKAVAEGWDPNKKTVREVMHKGVYFCLEDDPLEKVIQQMEKLQVRRLIVLNKSKRMTGIISLGDIATKSRNAKLCYELAEAVSHH
ncbi:Hypoxic response protein 1 [Aquicella siphonis]|uniref:Hypoxic response protein 1 n=1 Tax=Aquicella siphonis TaxID=254247 RepID=A0A5E4PGU2_9COXI|nr:CBS domain-containing protein [Aquicella siphonis]VVC75677.1 Hypoxic response protein 1 [Aquicella siphonis]